MRKLFFALILLASAALAVAAFGMEVTRTQAAARFDQAMTHDRDASRTISPHASRTDLAAPADTPQPGHDVWSYAPYVAVATLCALGAGAIWRLNRR